MTLMSQAVVEDCAEFGCPNGCVQIDYGVDDNGDGSLDNASEIDDWPSFVKTYRLKII